MNTRALPFGVVLFFMAHALSGQDPCAPGQATACGNCMFEIESKTLLTGTTGNEVRVLATNDICVFGYSIGIEVGDPARIAVASIDKVGTIGEEASFFEGGVSTDGSAAGVGVVFDFGDFSRLNLPPGEGSVALILNVDVLAEADTTTSIGFDQVRIPELSPQPIKNVMTNVAGESITPSLQPGTIDIRVDAPVIQSVAPGNGLAGQSITITGQNFDYDGLQVTVCDQVVAPTSSSATTIELAAPVCPTVGCVDVVVETVRGSDTDRFCYDPPAPSITGFRDNMGPPGTVFVIEGTNLSFNPSVTVCGVTAMIQNATDTALTVTAPDAPACDIGCAEVAVMTDGGDASDACGFTYECAPPVIASIDPAEARAGDTVVITGSGFDCGGLTVTICGQEATIASSDDTSITVEVPACAEPGAVDVTVTHDSGSETAAGALEFLADQEVFKRGDVNADGEVNISDASFLLNFLFLGGPTPPCMDAADANDDGNADISDASYILNFLFLGGPPPPAPGPATCGPDDQVKPPDDLPECVYERC